jgi:phospholipase C
MFRTSLKRSNSSPRCRRRTASVPVGVETLENRLTPSNNPLQQIDHIIVVYQENWSFDGLYGSFPGANGISNASATSLNQLDRVGNTSLSSEATNKPAYTYDPSTLQNPPPPLTLSDKVDPRFLTDPSNPNSPTAVNTLKPYDVGPFVPPSSTTGDIVHRFYQEQSQIDGGAQNKFVTWSDNPGLVMSHFDATNMPEGLLAQQYTMDDNFFHAAFGGSFLNHQFLVAAAAPTYPNAPTSMLAVVDSSGQQLALGANGQILHDGNITPTQAQAQNQPSLNSNYPAGNSPFAQNYAINTIFSDNLIPAGFKGITVDPVTGKITLPASLLPTQNGLTIGDLLDNAGVSWKWYSGGWDAALASSPSNPANNGATPANAPVDPNFQWHHQPFAYYNNFAPFLYNPATGKFVVNNSSTTVNANGSKHLEDETSLFQDLESGTLPAVSFIKQVGENNEHPGYADLLQGQEATADIVHAVQNSADWAHTAIVITYDENGGRWDHVSAPDNNGLWGDGTRVPTIVISPYAKKGYVDHQEHDTLSILKTIEERFHLPSLNTYDAHASDLSNDFQAKPQVSLGTAYVQPDAENPGKFTLVVEGTEGSDDIHISLDKTSTELHVTIKSEDDVRFDKYFAQPISRIEVYTQGGNDEVVIDKAVTTPAFVFAGTGNDDLTGGGGPTVLVGGKGNDRLSGGSGPSILIGGSGHAHLRGGLGDSLLIAGFTNYDGNLQALQALLNEWSATGETFAQKVAHIEGVTGGGLNGSYVLDGNTVHHKKSDVLTDSPGTAAHDLIFARLAGKHRDHLDDLDPGDQLFDI